MMFVHEDARFEVKEHPHIELRDGSPLIEGSRVPVRRLWDFHKRGTPIATLIARYPLLGPARVLSALAFAYDNEDLIVWDLERSNRSIEEEKRG